MYAGSVLVQVRRRAVERRVQEIQITVKRLEAGGDPAQLAAAKNELWVLQQYDQALKVHGPDAL